MVCSIVVIVVVVVKIGGRANVDGSIIKEFVVVEAMVEVSKVLVSIVVVAKVDKIYIKIEKSIENLKKI